MNSKKAITLLVLATMLLSITPVIVSNAITVGNLEEWDDGYYPLPTGVTKGMTIAVTGTGATPGRQVKVYWDGLDQLLNTTTAKGNGDYEVWFDVPEAVNGEHWITVENVYNGQYDTYLGAPVNMEASLSMSPKSGLPVDVITVKGYGFGDEEDVEWIQFDYTNVTATPSTPTTNDVGSWTATFKVPSVTTDVTYDVYAEDAAGNNATKTFYVGASITLNKESGPSGTVVRITGRGFTKFAGIGNGTITFDGDDCYIITDSAKVKSNGEFTCDVVIPDVGEDEYELEVIESGAAPGVSASADFEQTGRPAIELSPEYGPVGSTITVKGYNFTQISGEDVVIELDGLQPKTVTTNSAGEFTTTYRIPGSSGTPMLWAGQEDFGIEAEEPFRVGFISVVMYPETATAGEEVTVTGSGFEGTCNVTLDGELWMDELSAGTGGVIDGKNWVPTMEPGVYDVVVTETSGISVTVELTVSENTYVTLSPLTAPATYDVDIEGFNFAQYPDQTSLNFLLYNDTDEWILDVFYDGSIVNLEDDEDWDEGYFEATFKLPDSESISIGSYMINVTDGEGMWAQIAFDVVSKTVSIDPKKTVFRVGETLGFNVETSFKQEDSWIKIWDPSGNLYWQTDAFDADVWVKVGTIMRVPYYSQVAGGNPMTFLEDAPLGTWTWKWYIYDEDEGENVVLDEGTFTVEAAAQDVVAGQVEDLANQITDLASQLEDVSGEFSDVKSDIANVAAVAQQAVAAAQQAAQAVQTVATTANQANTAAQAAADAANAAKDAANGLTTLVYGAIGAALVAALAAIVSLMQISRRIAG
jgi:hypothetical protein